jgi:glycosyltransferase involved in cell wall biosynthesis
MRFGINAQRLAGQRLGVGRYLEYLFTNWNRMLAPSETMSLYLRDEVDTGALHLGPNFKVEQLRSRLPVFLWEQLVLAGRGQELDVLFGPSYTLPLAYRGRSVVATHSVNEIQQGAHQWWYVAYKEYYKLCAKKADAVIVPCEATKADLVRLYGIHPEKIDVIPQGADDAFRPIDDQQLLSETRKQLLGADLPYVLFVGSLSHRRNSPLLVAAFSEVKKRRRIPHKLLLFGPNHVNIPLKEIAAKRGVADSVIQTDGKVTSHKELVAIYNAADVFVHPSSYEGWSMTTTEALACGTAVIATNRGGLGELAAGHAMMLDEPTVESLADAIEQVLTDDGLRAELRAKARIRGSSLRWEDTSRQTLDVLRRVAQC